jgi:hypothetical protein
MRSSLIADAEQVTQDWLEAALRENGHLPQGKVTSFEKNASRPFGATTVVIDVSYSADASAGLPTSFLVKIDGPDTAAGNHEVEFYSRYGSGQLNFPTARCFDSAYDETRRAYHILLENLTATHYSIEREAPPTQAEAERMIDALAMLHATWWDKVDNDINLVDDGMLDGAPDHLPKFIDFMGDRLTPERRQIFEQIVTKLPALLKNRMGHDLTLVHDDAHTWNFLQPRSPQQDRAVMIDWQQWGRSVGAHDVAYLITLFWYPDHRRRLEQPMLKRYHARLLEYGVHDYSWEMCWYDYRLYTLRNMLIPIRAHLWGHWMPHPWMQMEKSLFAFHDLSCADLLA